MKNFQLKALSFFLCIFLFSTVANAQEMKKPASPHKSVKGTTASGATITIRYGSPYVKGRKIFGDLEPWGKVYRAGADSATTFITNENIKVDGKMLPAGKYAFFVIPMEKGAWTVIFNKTAEQWGAFKYDEKMDELRIMVKPKKIASQESLGYEITPAGFTFMWDTVAIPVKVTK